MQTGPCISRDVSGGILISSAGKSGERMQNGDERTWLRVFRTRSKKSSEDQETRARTKNILGKYG